MTNDFIPFGANIRVVPKTKDYIAQPQEGTFLDIGEVVAVGDEVKKIKVGDEVSYWLFGIKSVDHDGTLHHIIPEDSRFILEVCKQTKKE